MDKFSSHLIQLTLVQFIFITKLKTFSFLDLIVLKGIKWIISRIRFFGVYTFASKDDKSYSATFDQIPSKSDEAFSIYAQTNGSPHSDLLKADFFEIFKLFT